MEEVFNWRRGICIAAMGIIIGLLTYFICVYEKFIIDDCICFAFIDLMFWLLLIFELCYSRTNRLISHNRNTSYFKILLGFTICCIITGGSVFLPVYVKPAMIIAIIMFSVSNEMIAIFCGIFLSMLLTLSVACDYYESLELILLVLFGTILSQRLEDTKKRKYALLLMFLFNICIPAIFYYWGYKKFPQQIIIYNVCMGLITVIIGIICNLILRPETDSEIDNMLIDIIDDNYSQVIELRNYSLAEYNHSRSASNLAFKCAKASGLNPNLCAAAAFYYRIGKWQQDGSVYKGVRAAQKRCFPELLVNILEEYYGEIKPISSPESALVHLVDVIIKKYVNIEEEVGKSHWNKEIVLFQIFNDLSSSGIYDKSGLGMNHFLKIRECIIKEVSQ